MTHDVPTHSKIYKEVYSAVHPKAPLPLEMTLHDYKKTMTQKVMSLVNKGYSVSTAYTMVTGDDLPRKKGRHRKESNHRGMKIALASAGLALVGAIGAVGTTVVGHGHNPVSTFAASSDDSLSSVSDTTGTKNILLVGMDTRPEKDKGSGTSKDVPGNRTDSIMLARISPHAHHPVTLISIPRDTGVTTLSCDNGTRIPRKINSIYDDGGMECLTNVVSDMTGEDIDGSAEINFESFTSIIDTLGGISITTKSPVVDDTLGVIIPRAGTNKLNGDTALKYARARKVEGTGKSDFDRAKRQQQVVKATLSALNNSNYVSKLSAAQSLISDVLPQSHAKGLGVSDILSLMKMAPSLHSQDIATMTIPTNGEDGQGNLLYNKYDVRSAISALNSDAADVRRVSKDNE